MQILVSIIQVFVELTINPEMNTISGNATMTSKKFKRK